MNVKHWGMMVLAIATAVGCGETNPQADVAEAAAPDPTYVMTTEPTGAAGVGEVRDSSEEEVMVVGRIGGSVEPFVDGLAAFTIVDPAVPYCADEEGCPTPWDYCCKQNQVKDNIATVKVVNEKGDIVAKDAPELLGVKELSTVVVKGKAERDKQGNLTVLAEQVYVKN